MKQLVESELQTWPLSRLRNLDITSKEDELLVQRIVNEKMAELPDQYPIQASYYDTDNIRTKEDELRLQARLDEARAARRARLMPEEEPEAREDQEIPVPPTPEPEPIPTEAHENPVISKVKRAKKS